MVAIIQCFEFLDIKIKGVNNIHDEKLINAVIVKSENAFSWKCIFMESNENAYSWEVAFGHLNLFYFFT